MNNFINDFRVSTPIIDKLITKYSVVDKHYLQAVDNVDNQPKTIATRGFIWYYICVLVMNNQTRQKFLSTDCG